MIPMRYLLALGLLVSTLSAQSLPAIKAKTAGMRPLPGYIPMYWDEKAGKLWLELGNWTEHVLYYPSLPAGVGSNDIGLDRGQLGGEKLVRWQRQGPKVLLVHVNTRYISTSPDRVERRTVSDSFAESVLWGFEVAAEDGERVLVDATAFLLRDAHGIAERMREASQGAFKVDPSRSALYEPRTKNFPQNTEIETVLTLTSDNPGPLVRSVAPTAEAVTVRQHHSFVHLPPMPYRSRAFDPRAGFFPGATFMDYSSPLGDPVTKRWIARHRLEKKNPDAAVSEPVKPIVYYLDPGAPEPVRTALLEGARWWSAAFEAAGFRNAWRVEMLPADADPMDIRYNVIQWVHRSTRGWSYGASVTDPRSGEILKGHVTLGSLRVRQDYLIAEGLLAPYEGDKATSPEAERMALARLKQLSAHEVGHTLGISHNFSASTSERASVMDYPHPFAALTSSGAPDLSKAYAEGIGEWDKVAIAWGYREIAPREEKRELDALLAEAQRRGLGFLTDQDARPAGGAHPRAHLWDNGASATAELLRVLNVRKRALDRFGENAIRPGIPLSNLEDVLVPLYFGHRYQLEAAVRLVGGVEYSYAVRGDGQPPVRLVPGPEQHQALKAVLQTIQPATLTLPERLLGLIPPRAWEYGRTRESFRGRAGLVFDPAAAAEAAADLTFGFLLHPERAARAVQQHARDIATPSLEQVIGAVLDHTWRAAKPAGLAGEIARAIDVVALYHLMRLASAESAPAQVWAITTAQLTALRVRLKGAAGAHSEYGAAAIERFLDEPKQPSLPVPLEAPPGQPI